MDRRTVRQMRIKNDVDELLTHHNSAFSFKVSDDYELVTVTCNIRTIIGVDSSGNPRYRDKSTVEITFPQNYPDSAPYAKMKEAKPFHPNWYPDGHWCYGRWFLDEPLWSYIRRMMKTLQFDSKITNPGSPADKDALPFWNDPKNKKYFPTDRQNLDNSSRLKIKYQTI